MPDSVSESDLRARPLTAARTAAAQTASAHGEVLHQAINLMQSAYAKLRMVNVTKASSKVKA